MPKTFEDADVIYYELLKLNETITGERYLTHLMRLSRALCEKRPQYEQRPHPPYSPDIAPSDYYFFRSMAHGLAHQQFRSYQDIEKWLNL